MGLGSAHPSAIWKRISSPLKTNRQTLARESLEWPNHDSQRCGLVFEKYQMNGTEGVKPYPEHSLPHSDVFKIDPKGPSLSPTPLARPTAAQAD